MFPIEPQTPPPLTRPQVYEARRLRAAELFTQDWTNRQVAVALGVSGEAVRRWRLAWAKGGTDALRRRLASGRPPGLSPEQTARVAAVLLAGGRASGFATDLWTLDRIGQVIARTTGVHLARSSVGGCCNGSAGAPSVPSAAPKRPTSRRSPAG